MKKATFSLFVLLFAISVIIPFTAGALSEEDIVFPIAELGLCESEDSCRSYCDAPEHFGACIDFAEEHHLLSDAEIEHARQFQNFGVLEGPGGCTDANSCERYCDDITHLNECLTYAEEHDLISGDELEEALKIKAALDAGAVLPGGCSSKDSCEAYCEDPSNINECLAFAEAAGFLDEEEIEETRRAMTIIAEGRSPGGCQSERACHAYCADEDHFEECVAFAEEAGFISVEEAEMARKTGGKGPGGCVRDECETYCEDPAHMNECLAFALEHGLISEEELEHIQQGFDAFMHEGDVEGPGGCSSREECEAYCSDSNNKEACSRFFGEEDHLEPADDFLGEAEEFAPHDFVLPDEVPQDVRACVESQLGADIVERLAVGEVSPEEMREHVEECFRESLEQQFDEFEGFDELTDFDVHEEYFEGDELLPSDFNNEFPEEYEGQFEEHFDEAVDVFEDQDFPQSEEDHSQTLDEFPGGAPDVPPEYREGENPDSEGVSFLNLLNYLLANIFGAFAQ